MRDRLFPGSPGRKSARRGGSLEAPLGAAWARLPESVRGPLRRAFPPLRAGWARLPESVRGPLRRGFLGRRFQAYCVGLSRSGTHSIAGLFDGAYRAGHEADGGLREAIYGQLDRTLDEAGVRRLLLKRDRTLYLELDSANQLFFVIEDLVALFPNAKFIFTIRHALYWLDSRLNSHHYWGRASTHWPRTWEARYGLPKGHPREEAVLAERGLFTLDGYLAGWTEHNQRVLAAVPPERLLIVRTHEIGAKLKEIADFVGVPVETLDPARSHEDASRVRYRMLDRIPPAHLEAKIRRHCGDLMSRFFPEFPLMSAPPGKTTP